LFLYHRGRNQTLGVNMKYVKIGDNDHIPEERSWYYDDHGNRLDKQTNQVVVLVPTLKNDIERDPMVLVNVEGEWIPKQMEFEFG